MKLPLLLAITGASTLSVVHAQSERDLDSHEHGAALMNIALEESSVFIELETPWDNFVGFEHAPSTDEQKELVASTLELLNQPDQLFAFEGGTCVSAAVSIDSDIGNDEDHHDEEHGHDKETTESDHKDEHDDDEHHDEEHGHDKETAESDHKDEHDDDEHGEHDHEESTHSSALVSYEFSCDNADSLSTINVNILSMWPGFEEIDVQLIGPGGQSLTTLGADNASVELGDVR